MDSNDFYELGYVSRIHGIKGALVLNLDVDDPQRYKDLDELWLKESNSLVKFKVQKISVNGNTAIVQLTTLNSPEEAQRYIWATACLPLMMLPPLKGKKFYFHEVRNFLITDKIIGEIGRILTVYGNAMQPLALLKYKSKEILIPLIPEFIEEIDREKREIRMQLPDGITEV